jgi:Na+-translocating ferredoxin:NAD+ oxidoreductase RnfD subunit
MRPTRGLRDTPSRMAWTLAALAPLVSLEAFARGGAWVLFLLLAIGSAMVATLLANRHGRPITPWLLANLDVAVAAIIVFLLLYGDADPWLALGTTVLSVLLARNLFGGLGQSLFNPGMLALALLGLQATATPTSWSEWTVIACWLVGGALLVGGLVSWRTPVAFLAGAFATDLLSGNPVTQAGQFFAAPGNPALVICAFFVAGDPVTGCIHPRARLAYGLCAGALVTLFLGWQPGIGLPLAMLLMNFMAPWLDQVLATARDRAISG